jgi:hypothetical protein
MPSDRLERRLSALETTAQSGRLIGFGYRRWLANAARHIDANERRVRARNPTFRPALPVSEKGATLLGAARQASSDAWTLQCPCLRQF